jgi:C4-dicarboxylate-specific signal transduction histidine kinase
MRISTVSPVGLKGLLPWTTVGLALVVFVADVLTPPDCVVSGLYVVVVLMAGRFCRAAALAGVCLACTVLTILAQLFAHRLVLGNDQIVYIGAFNTAVSIVAIGLSGYLVARGQNAEVALRQAQSDLTHVSRVTTMGALTASIAHEINQPIAGVVANASACLSWLARAGDAPEINEVREAANRIVRDGTRAAEIIGRIHKIFVKGEIERQSTNINQLLRETIELLGNEAIRHSVTIQVNLEEIPPIMADPVQLQQVVVNLILNGMDAMRDVAGDRKLVVRSWRLEDRLIAISVADLGQGVPPGHTEQIFDAFFTTKPHGTGLGLAISRSIVEAHDGQLSAMAHQPRGALFQITLPLPAQA